jgi:hypothetical protein
VAHSVASKPEYVASWRARHPDLNRARQVVYDRKHDAKREAKQLLRLYYQMPGNEARLAEMTALEALRPLPSATRQHLGNGSQSMLNG